MDYSGFIMSIKTKFENPKSIFLWIIADQDEKEIGFYCFQFTEHKKNIYFFSKIGITDVLLFCTSMY